MKDYMVGLLSVCFLAVALVGDGRLWNAWQSNSTNLRLIKGQAIITTSGSSHIWLVGMAAGQRDDQFVQRQAFEPALGFLLYNLPLIQAVLPADRETVRLAAKFYPESSEAWFWLGEAIVPAIRPGARQLISTRCR